MENKLVLLVLFCFYQGITDGQEFRLARFKTKRSYQSTGIRLTDSNHLVFQVKGSRDAMLGLATEDRNDLHALRWHIVLGKDGHPKDNLQNRLQSGKSWTKHCSHHSLTATEYKTFWLSWDQSSIRLGSGDIVGHNQYCKQRSGDLNTSTDFYVKLGSYGSQNAIHWIVRVPTNFTGADTPDIPDGRDIPDKRLVTTTKRPAGPSRVVLRDQVDSTIAAAVKIADVIKDDKHKKIAKTLRAVARNLSHFFSGIGALADIVLAFLPQEPSPMLQEMRESFKEVNAKIEQVQNQITSLSNSIDWKLMKRDFDNYANKIKTLSEKLDLLLTYEPNTSAYGSKQRDIIGYYDYHYDSHEFVNFLTDQEFFDSYIIFTGNDRGKVLDLMKVVLYYVTQASKIDAAYLHLKRVPQDHVEGEMRFWNRIFVEIQSQMIEIDERLKKAWSKQAKGEVGNFLIDNYGTSHSDFSNSLVNFLSEKYFWRDWFVVSYKEIIGGDNHAFGGCHTWYSLRKYGRNLIVSSVLDDDYYDRRTAFAAVNNLRTLCICGRSCIRKHWSTFTKPSDPACCKEEWARYLSDHIYGQGGINMNLVVNHKYPLYMASDKPDRITEHKKIKSCVRFFNVVTFM